MRDDLWFDIPEFEGFYKIKKNGDVKSLERIVKTKGGGSRVKKELILRPGKTAKGYFSVELCKNGIGKSISIHRLIGITFISNIENKPQINHKNGVKTDNRIDNLEWVTPAENMQHAFKTGLCDSSGIIGEKNGQAKLKLSQVLDIKRLLEGSNFLQKDIAVMFGVSKWTISKIKRGVTWSHA